MKKIKKAIALILTVTTIVASLAACGNNSSSASGTGSTENAAAAETNGGDKTTAEGGFKIGYNYFGSGSYALLSLANNTKQVIEAFGNEPMGMDDEFNIEKIIQDIENMISSGCDGLVLWIPADSMYETVSNMCAEAKVPFVLADKIPQDEAIKEKLLANEYFVGAVAPANAVYGEMLANYAIEQGWTKCFISGPGVGDPSDTPRQEAFREIFEAAGGTIYTETHTETADLALPQIENALTAYPDIDFVYGSGSDYGISACQALQNMGIDAKVLTSGLDAEALELLQDGTYMDVVNGDYWVCGTFAALVLQNYLDGTPLVDADGKAIWIDDIQPFEVPADQYDLYKQCFLDSTCYSNEALRGMSGLGYDAFVEALHSYSLDERLEANGYK